jgi:hypothetical protein
MDAAKNKQSKQPLTKRERAAQRLKSNMARIDALLPEVSEDDIDAFREAMARRISMFVGNRRRLWRSCELRVCRRARACIAQGGDCANAPPLRPDPDGAHEARAVASMYHALQAEVARRNLHEDASAPVPRVSSSGRGRKREPA